MGFSAVIFWLYWGYSFRLQAWRDAAERHAVWLNLLPQFEVRPMTGEISFAFGWLRPSDQPALTWDENQDRIALCSSVSLSTLSSAHRWSEVSDRKVPFSPQSNHIQFIFSTRLGELQIFIPPTCPEQIFYSKNKDGWVFTNDLRLAMRLAGKDLDERAVYALFQYRAVPPPLTLAKNVHRIPTGSSFCLTCKDNPGAGDPKIKRFFQSINSLDVADAQTPVSRVRLALDQILADVPAKSVLFFSGGVDSGLLASRLAAVGRTDIRLINFIFHPDDPEGEVARQMSRRFNMDLEQVLYEAEDIRNVLSRIGSDYTFPFGDLSLIPTNMLVHACLQRLQPTLVIEGTGADGAFGMVGEAQIWQTIYRIPLTIRRLVSAGYFLGKLWQYDSKLEARGRKVRRSLSVPLEQAAVINATLLEGIAYSTPASIQSFLTNTVRENVQVTGVDLNTDQRISLLDLVHVCAGRFAPKSSEPLRARGVQTLYPFLEPPMLQLSLSTPSCLKMENGQKKAILKSLLVEDLPAELVYRRKRNFAPPTQQMFAHSAIREFMNDFVMTRTNTLINFVHLGNLKELTNLIHKGEVLSNAAYNHLWVLTFASGWLQQLAW